MRRDFHNLITATWLLSFVSVLGLLLIVTTANAQNFNQEINYQGKLTDTTGAAVADGTYNIAFALYDAASGGTLVWISTTTVPVTNGLFSHMLGSSTSLTGVDFNQTLYLGVNIGGTGVPSWDGEMSPRKILGAVPAAFEAANLGGASSTQYLRSDIANAASALLSFTGGFISSASSTISELSTGTTTVTVFDVGGDVITDITGTGLSITNSTLNVGNLSTSTLDTASTYNAGYLLQASTTASGGFVWQATSSLGFSSQTLTVGTDNQVPYANAGGTDFDYSANFTFDGTNLGIGSSSPNTLITVEAAEDTALIALGDSTNNTQANVYTGTTTPNGRVSAPRGSLYIDTSSAQMYQNTDNSTGWSPFTNGTTTHMAKMTRDAAQSIPDSTDTKILFDNVEYDIGGIADATTNDRFDIKKDGRYLVTASIRLTIDDQDRTVLKYLVNGVGQYLVEVNASLASSPRPTAVISDVIDLQAGDYLEMEVFHNSGTNEDTSTNLVGKPRMSVIELAPSGGTGIDLFTDAGSNTYLTSTSDNLLIGTTTNTADSKFVVRQQNANDIVNIFDGSTEVFTILDGGNVGIGSSSPSSKLTVAGDTYIGGALRATGTIQFDALTDGLLFANGSGILSSYATSSLGLGDGTLGGLTDVNTTGALSGNLLSYNGSSWATTSTSSLGIPNTVGPTFIVAASDASDTTRADYVADGIHDEVEIQAAIDALPAGGGTVLLTEGTFNVATTTYTDKAISINVDNTRLIGSGHGTILKLADGYATGTVSIIDATSVDYVTISDLQIDGNDGLVTESGSYYGIEFTTVTYSTVENVYVHDVQDSGIYLDTSSNNTLTSNIFNSNNSKGLYILSSNNNSITDNKVNSNGNYGIQVSFSDTNTINSNITNSNLNYGIILSGSDKNTVVGNTSNNNGDNGIRVSSGSFQNTISANTLVDNGNAGDVSILITSSSVDNIITGNTIEDTEGEDLALIQIDAGSDRNLIANNIYVADNRDDSDYITDNGTDTRFDDYNRTTITSTANVGYNLFNVTGTSSVALASLAQYGTGDIVNIFDGSTEVFTILDGGNVGIGDTSPAYLFTVGNGDLFGVNSSGLIATESVASSSLVAAGTWTDEYVLQASSTAAGGFAWVATSTLGFSDTDTTLTVGTDNQVPYANAGGTDFDYSANFTFDGTNLGIGSSSPNTRLTVEAAEDTALIALGDSTNNTQANVYTGTTTPDGRVTAPRGSLFIDTSSAQMYQNTDNSTGWSPFTNGTTTHMAKMTRDAAQSIPNNTTTKIAFDNIDFDTGGIADATTNDRFDIKKDGKYLVSAYWRLNSVLADTEFMTISIRVNGSQVREIVSTAPNTGIVNVSAIDALDLQAGDYIEMYVKHIEGASVNTEPTISKPQMSVIELAPSGGTGIDLFTDAGDNTYLTSTSDNLLIGTTTNAADSKFVIRQQNANDIVNIFDGSTEVFTILDGGNVGIGDSSPAYLFTVGNGDLFGVNSSGLIATESVASSSLVAAGTWTDEYVLQASSTASGGFAWVATSTLGFSDTDTTLTVGTDNQVPYANAGGTDFDYSANFTFDGTNLGIGSSSPNTRLTVEAAEDTALIALGDSTNNTQANVYTGTTTPDGRVTAPRGSLFIDTSSAQMYQNTDNSTGWSPFTNGTTTHSARINMAIATSVPNATIVKMQMDTISHDIGGIADVTTHDRIDIKKDGRYMVSSQWHLPAVLDSGEQMQILIYVNGSNQNRAHAYGSGSGANPSVSITDVLDLNAGDYVEMYVYQETGSAQDTLGGIRVPYLAVAQLAPSGGTGIDLYTDAGDNTYLTSTSDNLLIGTTTNAADSKFVVRQQNANDIVNIFDGSTEVFTILDGGNVGIGDSSPAYLFTVGNGDLFGVNSSGLIATESVASSSLSAAGTWTDEYVLQASSTAAGGFAWVATSTLGFSDTDTTLTVGTDNQIPFSNAGGTDFDYSSNLTFDGDSLILSSTDPNPSNALIVGTQSGTNDIINLFDGATEVFTILDGGNVGIGDSSPAYLFTVGNGDLFGVNSSGLIATESVASSSLSAAGTWTDEYVLQASSTASGGMAWVATSTLGLGGGGSSLTVGTDNQIPFSNSGGTDFDYSANLTFDGTTFSAPTTTIAGNLSLSGTEANIALGSNFLSGDGDDEGVYVAASGRVAIGTTSTPYYFTVDSGTIDTGMAFVSTDFNANVSVEDSGGEIQFGSSGGNFRVLTGGSERMRLTTDGYLGIADTSADFGIEIVSSSTDGYFGISSAAANDGDLFVVDGTGRVGIGTTSPASTLDVWGGVTIGTSSAPLFTADTATNRVIVGGLDNEASESSALMTVFNGDFEVEPADVALISTTSVTNTVTNIQKRGDYIYVHTNPGGILVYEAHSPTNLSLVDTFGNAQSEHWSYYGDYIVAVEGFSGFDIFDISDPTNVVQVNGDDYSGDYLDVAMQGSYAYFAKDSGGFEVVDISNPEAPVQTATLSGFNNDVEHLEIDGHYVYVIGDDYLSAVDISDPNNPTIAGTLVITGGVTHHISIQDELLYATIDSGNVFIYDISDPANITEVNSFSPAGGNEQGMFVSGDYLYTGTNVRTVAITDISDPRTQNTLASFETENTLASSVNSLFADENYLYVGIGSVLEIYNLSTIKAPGASIGNLYASNAYMNYLRSDFFDVRNGFTTGGASFIQDGLTVTGRSSSTDNVLTPQLLLTGHDDFRDSYLSFQIGPADEVQYVWSMGLDQTDNSFRISSSTSLGTNDYLTIGSDGNVGIGTTSPMATLAVAGDVAVTGGITMTGTVQNITLGSNWISNDGANEGIFINSNNYVGLNTNNPQVELEIDSSNPRMRFTDSNGSTFQLRSQNDVFELSDVSTGAVVFAVEDGAPASTLYLHASGTVNIGSTTSNVGKLSIDTSTFTGAGTMGINQYYETINSIESAVQFGNLSYIDATNTATTTLIGSMFRVADTTQLGNTVRGLEVQANKGGNTAGENTALSGFARTFGVRGFSSGDAVDTFEPAGGFFETGGSTQGNAIRGYSQTITSADLLSLYQEDSAFTGAGLLMNFGNDTGSFSSTSSRFIDLQNAGSSKFLVYQDGTATIVGTTTIGASTTATMASLHIGYGGLCVDNDGSCEATTTGRISSVSQYTGNSDLAEIYFSADDLLPGEIVSSDGFISVTRADKQEGAQVLGVISTKPGLLMGSDDISLVAGQRAYPLALSGRVPVRLSTENGAIETGDPLTLSAVPGVAMKATDADEIVGYALESFDGVYAYTEGYINQFGDDIAKPDYSRLPILTAEKTKADCYYGGGGAAGEEEAVCDPDEFEVTIPDDMEEEAAIAAARYEAEQAALAALRDQPAETVQVGDGEVQVGTVIMFVDLGVHIPAEQRNILTALLSTSTLENAVDENDTMWSRLQSLARNFVAGVLEVVGLKADRVETSELCVDDVCIDADDLRQLLKNADSTTGQNSNTDTSETDTDENTTDTDNDIVTDTSEETTSSTTDTNNVSEASEPTDSTVQASTTEDISNSVPETASSTEQVGEQDETVEDITTSVEAETDEETGDSINDSSTREEVDIESEPAATDETTVVEANAETTSEADASQEVESQPPSQDIEITDEQAVTSS